MSEDINNPEEITNDEHDHGHKKHHDDDEENEVEEIEIFEYAEAKTKVYLEISEQEKLEVEGKMNYLTSELEKSIKLYESRGNLNKRPALIFKVLSTGLSSVVTILLGIRITNALAVTIMGNMALAISALSTVVTAWNAFFDYTELWVQYSRTVEELNLLKKDIEYLRAGNGAITVHEINHIKKKYDQILLDSANLTVKVRSQDSVKTAK